MALKVVILAAGKGKRMCSSLPKVLYPLAGKSLIEHVLAATRALAPEKLYLIHGHQGQLIQEKIFGDDLQWVHQAEQLGTGHAVSCALPYINDEDTVLILLGDVPLIETQTLTKLIKTTPNFGMGLIVAHFQDPTGLGRIVRNHKGEITAIVEEKDASDAERQIHEINAGIMLVQGADLKNWLPKLSNENAQSEFYLPGIIKFAVSEQKPINSIAATKQQEVQGVNNRLELVRLERFYQQQIAEGLLLKGVTIKDPANFYVRGEIDIAEDVTIDVNVILEGQVSIGKHSTIEANCILRNVQIGENVHIAANTVIEDAVIKDNVNIGPFARIRPDTVIAENAKIGNFVEVKKSQIGIGSKVPHLSYVGDTIIGNNVNVGAGTITCNYDGANKHQTIIEDDVFIGSDSQLIAPIRVGKGATIAAGTTLTKDAPEDSLTLSRTEQKAIKGWKRPSKKEN